MSLSHKDPALKESMDPAFAVAIVPHPDNPKFGVVKHWMAFDPRYGPESEQQIEWHKKNGTPGADKFQVGKPTKP